MIRPLREGDFEAVTAIVNDGWRATYAGYVAPALLEDTGCRERAAALEQDFRSHRLEEYVWEEEGEVRALLSAGDTGDKDRPGAFELWRIYVAEKARGKGVGGKLLDFGEQLAWEKGKSQVVIWVFRRNTHALTFYQRHGYHIDRMEQLGEPYMAEGVRLIKGLEEARP
ncbi:MAG: GNAT family N-acetyltransferase [Angelakisella sp.]|nr:GNAT family N-acetyltransferase [Angelakisella sp.]